MLDKHLSDGRKWVLGGDEPTFCDTTLCAAIAFGKWGPMHTDLTHRFEYLEYYWKRWQERDSFKVGSTSLIKGVIADHFVEEFL